MITDWIKMRKTLLTDPRVVRISSALGADRFRTIGGLFAAWCLMDEQTTDGVLVGYNAAAFDEVVGIKGIAEAMESVGWLEISPQGIAATEFDKHNGKTAKRRAQENVRKMSARDADKHRTNTGRKSGQSAPQEEEEEEEYSSPNPSCNKGGKGELPNVDWDTVTERANWLASNLSAKATDRLTFAKVGVLMQTTLGDAEVTDALHGSRGKQKPIGYFLGTLRQIAVDGGWDWDAALKAIRVPRDVVESVETGKARRIAT